MSASLWLRQIHRRLFDPRFAPTQQRRRQKYSPVRRTVRLRLEALEDRVTPTLFTPTVFTDGAGIGSLRDAVIAANTDTGTATDTIQLSAGTYSLTIPNTASNHDVSSTQGDLNITSTAHELIIQGTTDANGNPTSVIDQTVADRVFQILNLGGGSAGRVIFENLVIEGGNAQDDGTAGAVAGQSTAQGGGILDDGGEVTLSNVVVQNNQATGSGSHLAQGGGIFAQDSDLTLSYNVIQNNTATGGAGGGDGGGVYSAGNTTIIALSTLANNSATNSGGGAALSGSVQVNISTVANNTAADQGGGIYFEPTKSAATIQLNADTVSGNQGGASGGLDDNNGTPNNVTLVNTIVAGNSITNNTGTPTQDITPAGHIISGGNNLIGINNGFQSLDANGNGFTNPTDLLGTAANPLDPKLGPLQNNGGPTQTMLPAAGSPVLGAGQPALGPDADQRGVIRPPGGPIDIGAVQVSAAPSPPPAPAPHPAPAPPTLQVPPLLAFLDSLLGGIETVNGNGTETVTDSFFGIPLIVSTFNSAGNLVSVTLFGFNITFLFG